MTLRRCTLFAFALFLMLALCVREGGPSPRLSPAQADDLASPPFDPDVVLPVAGSARAQALEALRASDFKSAQRLALSGLHDASFTEAALLRWLASSAARELGDTAAVVAALDPLASSDHPLSPWARLTLAQTLEGSQAQVALAHAEALLGGSSELETWPGRVELERLRARILGKLGRTDEAIAELTRLLGSTPDELAPIPVLLPLADLLSVRTEPERVRALALYRSVAARVPLTKLGRRAEERSTAMLASLSPALRSVHTQPALATRLARADALLADMRFADAESAYDALERSLSGDAPLLCRVRFGRAKALLDRRAREAGGALMAQVADSCSEDTDQRAWARYHAGRAYSNLGQNELAIAQYEALERESPGHRLADDALFRAAKVARDMGDLAGVESRLQLLPQRYPQGDMGPRARFALAWHAHARGEYARAVEILAPGTPDEDSEDVQGRAGYFRGRFLLELARKPEAAQAFAEVFERHPLTYYGRQAYGRLRALDPARASELLSRLSHVQPAQLTFERTLELSTPGFARALALFSAGDVGNGLNELRALGMTSGDAERSWLVVSLLDRAQAPHLAVDLARRHMAALLARTPRGRDLALYRLVYPGAFAPLIEQSAEREGVPGSFVRAVAREESGFFAGAVSKANARGLIQVIEPTAKLIAKGLGLPHNAEALARPEVNLAIGVRFISTLAGNLQGQYALVPAAYNAGPTVTSRWLSERASEPLDVWVENIPYDETRHYTRRVLQSYGVYHFLGTGELLELPFQLPAL